LKKILIDGSSLTLKSLERVTRGMEQVELSEKAVQKITRARNLVERFVEEEKIVYGITTGFGKFSDVFINKEDAKTLQRNLIISHACGVGDSLSEDVVRGIMLLRANALTKGNSGIRLVTLNLLIDMLNKGVHPIVPEKGSLGASGDLAPLAHMVLVMIGEGEAIYKGEKMTGAEALKAASLEPVELTSKEGLALINGTQVMTSVGAHALIDAIKLCKMSDIVASTTIEALNGIIDAFDDRIHQLRPHKGQINTAKNIRTILNDSKMTTNQGELRVQDAYTLRCIPQIHGASKDALSYAIEKVEIEMNSVTDNPLIFPETEQAISQGNFHGQPMALIFDYLAIAVSELANASERRLERLVNPALSNGLPAFLTPVGGLNSGFMIVQYSAASLVSENKVLAHPASVDSIPSSANQEDHVSMGTIAARKLRDIVFNASYVLSMEWLASVQAIDLRENKEMSTATKFGYNKLREESSMIIKDRVMNIEIEKTHDLLMKQSFVNEIEEMVGEIEI